MDVENLKKKKFKTEIMEGVLLKLNLDGLVTH